MGKGRPKLKSKLFRMRLSIERISACRREQVLSNLFIDRRLSRHYLVIAIVGNVNKVYNLRSVHLFVLGGNHHCRNANQLQLVSLDVGVLKRKRYEVTPENETQSSRGGREARLSKSNTNDLEKSIDDGDSEVESFLQQVESHAHLHQPVDQDTSHFPSNLAALVEIERLNELHSLQVA